MAKWNEIDQTTISQTVRELATYLQARNIGEIHNELCQEWLKKDGLADQILTMNQGELDYLFGKGDPQNYFPGKFRPTLIDLKTDLEFLAQMEKLDSSAQAQNLMEKIAAFDGFGGSCHDSFTDFYHETNAFIQNAPHHPDDIYLPPAPPPAPDVYNSVNYAFDHLEQTWLPVDDDTVQTTISLANLTSIGNERTQFIAEYISTFHEGFRRAGVSVDIQVVYGKTYGEDNIVITATLDEHEKIVDVYKGYRHVDKTIPGKDEDIYGASPVDNFNGYEPGKKAFIGCNSTYYFLADEIKDSDSIRINSTLNWLKQAHSVTTAEVFLPSPQGNLRYTTMQYKRPTQENTPILVNHRYHDSLAIQNLTHEKLHFLLDVVRGIPAKANNFPGNTGKKLSGEWFEHDGKIFVDKNEPFQQALFHMQYLYGASHGWVYRVGNAELERLDGNSTMGIFTNNAIDICDPHRPLREAVNKHDWLVLHIDKLPDGKRDRVRAAAVELCNRIAADIQIGNNGMVVERDLIEQAQEQLHDPKTTRPVAKLKRMQLRK